MTKSRLLLRPGHGPAIRDADVSAILPPDMPVGPDDLVMPAPVNAHDHGYGIRTLGFGAPDDALEAWIPYMRLRPRTDAYLEALVSFARVARMGVGATMHCHNSLNADALVDEALAVTRAAGDIGIRLGFSCPLLDFDAWAYDGGPERLKPHLSPENWQTLSGRLPRYAPVRRQVEAVEAVAAANTNPLVTVQYGPIGPQWCSDELLQAIAEASALNDRRIHMHLLESPRQRVWLDRRFPQGIVRYLDEIGFLSPRLAVAHGVHLRPDEYELMAERGVQIVSNTSANLRLRSGLAPLAKLSDRGVPFAIGLDGGAIDDDQDIWREIRLAYLAHGGREMQRGFTAATLFDAAIHTGAKVVGAPAAQDFVVIDYSALSSDFLFDDIDETEALLTRMTGRQVKGLAVAGREIFRDGRFLTVDVDAAERELMAQARADAPRLRNERPLADMLASAVREYYRDWT